MSANTDMTIRVRVVPMPGFHLHDDDPDCDPLIVNDDDQSNNVLVDSDDVAAVIEDALHGYRPRPPFGVMWKIEIDR